MRVDRDLVDPAVLHRVQGNILSQYLGGTYASLAFPTTNYNGPLDSVSRMYISGEGRVVGALRIRQARAPLPRAAFTPPPCNLRVLTSPLQLRTKPRDCVIPSNLKEVNNVSIVCQNDYSTGAALKEPIYGSVGSTAYNALGDFYLPFQYQTASDLDARDIKLQGTFANYDAAGFDLDAIPNIPPNALAAALDDCWQMARVGTRLQPAAECSIHAMPVASSSSSYGVAPATVTGHDRQVRGRAGHR